MPIQGQARRHKTEHNADVNLWITSVVVSWIRRPLRDGRKHQHIPVKQDIRTGEKTRSSEAHSLSPNSTHSMTSERPILHNVYFCRKYGPFAFYLLFFFGFTVVFLCCFKLHFVRCLFGSCYAVRLPSVCYFFLLLCFNAVSVCVSCVVFRAFRMLCFVRCETCVVFRCVSCVVLESSKNPGKER